jgi:hypothetical protein
VSESGSGSGSKTGREATAGAARWIDVDPDITELRDRAFTWASQWRPPRIRVLLLAGSPPAPEPGDLQVRVRPPTWTGLRDAPAGFCRAVHCLGWSEPTLCSPRPLEAPADAAAWRYWDLLGVCARSDASNVARRPVADGGDTAITARLHWKLSTLRLLRQRGIWFVHAPAGRPSRAGLTPAEALREAVGRTLAPLLDRGTEQVWIVGDDAARALSDLPAFAGARALPEVADARFPAALARLSSGLST